MKNALFVVVAMAVAAGLLAAGWYASAPQHLNRAAAAAVGAPGDAAAGRIVFFASGCGSCHMSPGQSDLLRIGGGRPIQTSFGVFYAPNISPDVTDGIGAWSAQDFARAVLLGVSPTGQHYYPVFPYSSYRRMTPTDVRDLYAFIRTLPAVSGRAPPGAPLLPYSIRRSIGLWKRLYAGARPFPDAPGRDAAWRLGRYLVEGPGHCAECHSPRDILGGLVAHRRLTGGRSPNGGSFAPDITAAGLKNWTTAQIAEALRTGATPRGDMFEGLMAIVVRNLGELPDSYRDAIAEYLKTVGAEDAPSGGVARQD
ncbi:MAG: cytochrome c [Hyphomicrobiales bacterium]|nr:cytochrome c [Hyphomicrobiales bacterium]MBV8664446.1 cytochrome c [Hyphomicrobiales bacterium]